MIDILIKNARKIRYEILYEGKNITKYIEDDLINLTHSDSINEFDSLDLVIQNRNLIWISDWAPLKGERIEVKIFLESWETDKITEMNLGKFYVDRISYSGQPDVCEISALSVDITSNFMDKKMCRVWENISLLEVAHDIATECGLELVEYEVAGESNFSKLVSYEYKRVEARLETYFNLLKRLGKERGIFIKLYSNKLVLVEESKYAERDAILELSREDLASYSFATDDTDTYAGCKITYYDNIAGEKIEKSFFPKQRAGYKRGTQRVLFVNQEKEIPGKSKAQKEEYLGLLAKKALLESNKKSVTGNIKMLGKEQKLDVGDCIELKEFGIFDGKFLITKIDTDFRDYTLDIQIRKVEEYD